MAIVASSAAPVISCLLSSLVEMSRMDEASTSTVAWSVAMYSELPTTESVTLELSLIVSPPITSLTSGCDTLGADRNVPDTWLCEGAEENIKGTPRARRKSPRAQVRGLVARKGFGATEALVLPF